MRYFSITKVIHAITSHFYTLLELYFKWNLKSGYFTVSTLVLCISFLHFWLTSKIFLQSEVISWDLSLGSPLNYWIRNVMQMKIWSVPFERIRLLKNKFHWLSPSGGHHSLLFDQGFPNNLGLQRPLANRNAIWWYFAQFYIQLVFKAPLCITLTIFDQKHYLNHEG